MSDAIITFKCGVNDFKDSVDQAVRGMSDFGWAQVNLDKFLLDIWVAKHPKKKRRGKKWKGYKIKSQNPAGKP